MNLTSKQVGKIKIYEVKNAHCQGEFSLFGGHIMQWQPRTTEHAVLWQSNNSAMDGLAAIRGGIPICWPWFGDLAGNQKHGLARTAEWSLDSADEIAAGTQVKLSLQAPKMEGFPSRCEQVILFGESLKQELRIFNQDTETAFTFAFHNYFAISSLDQLELPFVKGVSYFDKVLGQESAASQAQPEFSQPVDRIYHSSDDAQLIDKKWNRRIHLNKSLCSDTVLWNPGSDAKGIADIHPGGEREYLCVESAVATPVKIAANSTITLGQTIRVDSI